MKIIYKNQKGYSLLEMVVSVAIFATIFLIVTSIYLSLISAQRSVIATQTIQESMKFVLELAGKELRTAQKSDNTCEASLGFTVDAPAKKIFNTHSTLPGLGDIVYFKNKNGECVAYYLENNRFKINRDGNDMFVTPDELDLSNLRFDVLDDDVGAFHSIQPTMTMRLDVSYTGSKNMHNQKTTLQTSITSRYYE